MKHDWLADEFSKGDYSEEILTIAIGYMDIAIVLR